MGWNELEQRQGQFGERGKRRRPGDVRLWAEGDAEVKNTSEERDVTDQEEPELEKKQMPNETRANETPRRMWVNITRTKGACGTVAFLPSVM